MPSNKDRLYVVLHARSTTATTPDMEERYHWSLLIGPKNLKRGKNGIRLDARNVIRDATQVWVSEQAHIHIGSTSTSLVRICIAKLVDTPRVLDLLHTVPVRPELPGWNCVSWVREALQELQPLQPKGDILGTSGVLEWEKVRNGAMTYVNRKIAEGRFTQSGDATKVATWDLMKGQEIIP